MINPSSLISTSAPVSEVILLIVSPPLPIIAPILSGLILIFSIRGAYGESSAFGSEITLNIWRRICSRPLREVKIAFSRTETGRP